MARVDGIWSESCSPPSEADYPDSRPLSGQIRFIEIALEYVTNTDVLELVFFTELGLTLSCCGAAAAATPSSATPSRTAKIIVPALPVARSPSADASPPAKIILPPLPLADSAHSGPAKKPPLIPALPCPARSPEQQQLTAPRGQEVSLRSEHGLQIAQATTPEGFIWRAEQTGKLVPCMPRVRGRDELQRRALHREYHEPPVFAEPLSDDWDSSAGSAPPGSCRAAEPGRPASRPPSRSPVEALRGLSSSNCFRCPLATVSVLT